jgi:hypothetical protein
MDPWGGGMRLMWDTRQCGLIVESREYRITKPFRMPISLSCQLAVF